MCPVLLTFSHGSHFLNLLSCLMFPSELPLICSVCERRMPQTSAPNGAYPAQVKLNNCAACFKREHLLTGTAIVQLFLAAGHIFWLFYYVLHSNRAPGEQIDCLFSDEFSDSSKQRYNCWTLFTNRTLTWIACLVFFVCLFLSPPPSKQNSCSWIPKFCFPNYILEQIYLMGLKQTNKPKLHFLE